MAKAAPFGIGRRGLLFLFRFVGIAGGFAGSVLAGGQGIGAFEGFVERAEIGESGDCLSEKENLIKQARIALSAMRFLYGKSRAFRNLKARLVFFIPLRGDCRRIRWFGTGWGSGHRRV